MNKKQDIKKARTLLRLLWQHFDAGGESCGRSFDADILETAMEYLGESDSEQDKFCDDDAFEYLHKCKEELGDRKHKKYIKWFNNFDEER